MASGPQSEPQSNRLFLVGLVLLVGFVIGFVVVLSRLPVEISQSDINTEGVHPDAKGDNYQFYSVLPGQTTAQTEAAVREVTGTTPDVIIPPATRVVPGSVQSLSARSLAAEDYAEIPANNLGQESYFLQAGNYRDPAEAEKSRASLLLLGFEAFIVVRQDSNGTSSHRVRIGPFVDQERISVAKERLKRNNINYKLIRVTG